VAHLDAAAELEPPGGALARNRRGLVVERGARRLPAAFGCAALSAVPDVLAPDLRVVFCGINPGFVSAAAGAHFANPRNDFWRLLHEAGFTPRLLAPEDQFEVVKFGIGLTNAASRTTRGSGDLRRSDFAGSTERLTGLAEELRPHWLAFVGKEAYRGTFGERPELGEQARKLVETRLFVLPSTSPANAAVPYPERLKWFRELASRASGS
jgi:TDG/mug DNA glycosylase family protein